MRVNIDGYSKTGKTTVANALRKRFPHATAVSECGGLYYLVIDPSAKLNPHACHILLDCPVSVAVARIDSLLYGKIDGLLKSDREAYLTLARERGVPVVSTDCAVEETLAAVMKHIATFETQRWQNAMSNVRATITRGGDT